MPGSATVNCAWLWNKQHYFSKPCCYHSPNLVLMFLFSVILLFSIGSVHGLLVLVYFGLYLLYLVPLLCLFSTYSWSVYPRKGFFLPLLFLLFIFQKHSFNNKSLSVCCLIYQQCSKKRFYQHSCQHLDSDFVITAAVLYAVTLWLAWTLNCKLLSYISRCWAKNAFCIIERVSYCSSKEANIRALKEEKLRKDWRHGSL